MSELATIDSVQPSELQAPQIPSERDWDIYRLVKVEQWPTRTAAKLSCVEQSRAETTAATAPARSVQPQAATGKSATLTAKQSARRRVFLQPG